MEKNLYVNLVQIIMYFIFWNEILNNNEGELTQIEKKYGTNFSLILPLNKKKMIHIHHWIYLLMLCKKCNKYKNFFIGGILQGLMYNDRMKIIKNRDSNTRFFLTKINY